MNPIAKTTPRDFFLHLGATIILYVSAVSLVNLSFSIINYEFPDVLAGYFYSSSVAWPISMLVVLVPALYLIEWFIQRDIKKAPEKDSLWIRRWRIYLTLFLTGATIIGDLITLINTYINGEISERFIYKFLAILVIFLVIFIYYILEKTTDISKSRIAKTILAYVGIVIVIASVIGGFIIVGSPYKQRSLRFDSQRVSDLSNIQWQIVNYWQSKGKLPLSLDDLKDSISGTTIPTDPENKTAYQYIFNGDLKFELCSVFSLKSQDTKGKGASGYNNSFDIIRYPYAISDENWTHDSGNICFKRTIDPERYPVKPK